jgi:hypothetical protein
MYFPVLEADSRSPSRALSYRTPEAVRKILPGCNSCICVVIINKQIHIIGLVAELIALSQLIIFRQFAS